ncbi:MAG: response regulator [bacterium]|nr:response regulator [bacterium]
MPTVLLIDDDPESARRVSSELEHRRLDVLRVRSLAAARPLLARGRFDLVVCNLFMPQKDGLDAVREIREHDADLPVVGLCGGPSWSGPSQHEASEGPLANDVVALALDLGATAVVGAPFDWLEFARAVEAALRGEGAPLRRTGTR